MSLRLHVERELRDRGWSALSVQKHGGPSYNTTQGILRGDVPSRGDVYERLDSVFGWEPGSAKLATTGADPVKRPAPKNDHPALATLATLHRVLPEEARTEAVTTLLDLLRDQIAGHAD